MEKLLYEGKAKKVYECDDNVIIYYKDDATAFNGLKKDSIESKGILNNKITALIYSKLNELGINTHFIKQLDERSQLCKSVTIIPLEVIVRNYAAGSISKRLGIAKGVKFNRPILEICYKKDELGDPLINDHHAITLGLCSKEQLAEIYEITLKVNKILKELFLQIDINIIDFKLEFGLDANNAIVLADEISPDTCRLWDSKSMEVFDKDLFRNDLGDLVGGYSEVLSRLERL